MVKASIVPGVLALLAATAGLLGCKVDNTTQITVAITAETKVPEEVGNIQIVVTDGAGSVVHDLVYDVTKQAFFPATLALIPRNSDSLDRPVDVVVRASKGSELVVLRHAVVSYAEERSLLLPLSLRMACFTVDNCKANETCIGGQCVPADVDAATLLDFDPKLVFGSTMGSDCFDETACLTTATPTPVDAVTCQFTLPEGGAEKANVCIQWAAAKDRMIVLDSGSPQEGWTRIDATTGRLARGVCDLLHAAATNPNAALQAFVSTSCVPKRSEQPYCKDGIGVTVKAP